MSAHHTLTINIDISRWSEIEKLATDRKSTPRTLINYAIEEYLYRNVPNINKQSLCD